MRVVLDTNVLVSGIFFSGTPARILAAWADKRFTLLASPSILEEYRRVVLEISAGFPAINVSPVLDLVVIHAEIVEDAASSRPLCRDPADDKFLLCAATGGALLVSGDKDLLAADGALGVHVLKPSQFVSRHLT